MNLDEKISEIKLERRRLQEDQEKTEQKPAEISAEEVERALKAGVLQWDGKTYEFERRILLDGRIQIPIVKNVLKETTIQTEGFVFLNETKGISFSGSFITEQTIKQSYTQFKEGMKQQFKGMGLFLEWIEEKEIQKGKTKISYGWFLSPTGYGTTYNLIFYIPLKGGTVIGTYNCFEKDTGLWKPLIEGCVQWIECIKE